MSTRARIAIETDRCYKSIYSHWDGYPDGLGVALKQFYPTSEDAAKLIEKGSMSTVNWNNGESLHYAVRSQWDDLGGEDEDWEDVQPVEDKNLDELQMRFLGGWEEYLYVYQLDGKLVCYAKRTDPHCELVEIPETR